jgi:AcrR family transcriptional regulator
VTSARRPTTRPPTTRDRLLEAALECAVHKGSTALSLQTIAAAANVSKALLLYHFRDKDDVLAMLITWLTGRVVAREESALLDSNAAEVLDALWSWLEREVERGELRALLELGSERGKRTREALASSGERRHDVADATMTRVFHLLRLTPKVPISMLAEAELAMRDGLVLAAAREPKRTVRAAFDVFWLAALRLAQ